MAELRASAKKAMTVIKDADKTAADANEASGEGTAARSVRRDRAGRDLPKKQTF